MKEKLGRAVKNSCFDVMFLNFILILKPQEAAEGQASCVAPWDVLQLFIDLDSNHKQLFETRAYAFPGSLESPAAQNRPTSKPVCYVPECVHIEYDSITLWYPCGFFFFQWCVVWVSICPSAFFVCFWSGLWSDLPSPSLGKQVMHQVGVSPPAAAPPVPPASQGLTEHRHTGIRP